MPDKTVLPNSVAVDYNIVLVYVIWIMSASISCSDGQTSIYEGLYTVNVCGAQNPKYLIIIVIIHWHSYYGGSCYDKAFSILPNFLISTLLVSVASLPLLLYIYIYIHTHSLSLQLDPSPSNCWHLHCYAFKGILLLLITSGYALTNGTLNSTQKMQRELWFTLCECIHNYWDYSVLGFDAVGHRCFGGTCCIPEYPNLNIHSHENQKSHVSWLICTPRKLPAG